MQGSPRVGGSRAGARVQPRYLQSIIQELEAANESCSRRTKRSCRATKSCIDDEELDYRKEELQSTTRS